jgi:hypothetical protein
MRFVCGVALAALALLPQGPAVAADWVPFHSHRGRTGTLEYFYDRSGLRSSPGKVLVHQKVVGNLSPTTTTMYVMEIDCREATFTEKGTTIIDAHGRRRRISRSELWLNHPIAPGTSADKLMKILCHKE